MKNFSLLVIQIFRLWTEDLDYQLSVADQDRVRRRGKNIQGRGRDQGHGRGEANSRDFPCEDQTRRAGLQYRTEPEERNWSNGSQ